MAYFIAWNESLYNLLKLESSHLIVILSKEILYKAFVQLLRFRERAF